MQNPAQDDVGTATGASTSIAFRRAPRAGPAASGWPVGPDRLTVRIDPHQPTLPWDGDEDSSVAVAETAMPGGPPPSRSHYGAIRILRFGGSWAGPAGHRLPDPAGWSIRLADALMEAVVGIRPVSQLNRWLAPPAMAQLTRRVRRRKPGERANLKAIHLHRTIAGRTEVVAVFGWAERTAAIAFRLDGFGGRWLCTALELAALHKPKRAAGQRQVSRRAGSRSSPA